MERRSALWPVEYIVYHQKRLNDCRQFLLQSTELSATLPVVQRGQGCSRKERLLLRMIPKRIASISSLSEYVFTATPFRDSVQTPCIWARRSGKHKPRGCCADSGIPDCRRYRYQHKGGFQADPLTLLDDRIALLRETNATLEAIAQALFKSWFVDFDPVHAKARGEPALPEPLAALFPDNFEESPLGLVPRGWRVGKVEDLMELAYGKALKSTDRIDGPVPVYGSGGITGCHNESLVDGPSIIIGRKGTVGSLYWEDRPFFISHASANLTGSTGCCYVATDARSKR